MSEGNTAQYIAGDYLFREGDMGDCMYIIQKGRIEIIKEGKGLLAEIAEGSLLGEMAVIDSQPRSASARAKDNVTVIKLAKNDVESSLKSLPPWVFGLFKTLSSRIRQMNERVNLDSLDDDKLRILRQVSLLTQSLGKQVNGKSGFELGNVKNKIYSTLGIPMDKIQNFIEFMINKKYFEFGDQDLILIRDMKEIEDYIKFLEIKNALVKQINTAQLQDLLKPEIKDFAGFLHGICESSRVKDTTWGKMIAFETLQNVYLIDKKANFPVSVFQDIIQIKLLFMKQNPYNNIVFVYMNAELIKHFLDFEVYGDKYQI